MSATINLGTDLLHCLRLLQADSESGGELLRRPHKCEFCNRIASIEIDGAHVCDVCEKELS
jgi:hypothetical protein